MAHYQFEKNPNGKNELLRLSENEGWYISYNATPTAGDGEETAIRVGDEFYILNGDYREEYLKRFPDKEACLGFYLAQPTESRSYWSTDNGEPSLGKMAQFFDEIARGGLWHN